MRLAQWGSHHEKLDGIGRLAHGFLGRLGPVEMVPTILTILTTLTRQ